MWDISEMTAYTLANEYGSEVTAYTLAKKYGHTEVMNLFESVSRRIEELCMYVHV